MLPGFIVQNTHGPRYSSLRQCVDKIKSVMHSSNEFDYCCVVIIIYTMMLMKKMMK